MIKRRFIALTLVVSLTVLLSAFAVIRLYLFSHPGFLKISYSIGEFVYEVDNPQVVAGYVDYVFVARVESIEKTVMDRED
ncbi:MAG: hypothetical protein LBC83_02395 [Oscillospiraceae bacterium]|jgi:hypothetical protein|nr:hypothetical protein [Oscillospiraceae bacterium]